MNEDFQRLYKEMCSEPQISYDRLQQIFKELRSAGDFTDDLLAALEAQVAAQNWRCVNLLVTPIHWNPSRKFTPLLCELLDNHKERINPEDIAETLEYIGDGRSVPSLVRALHYYVPGDDGRNLNKKIIYALANIGTDEAVEGLKQAAQNEDEQIKRTAEQELARVQLP